MLANALIAMDSTILATAVPSIVKDLGNYDRFPWLFSVYLLGQAVTVPAYGKIADTIGRKPVIQAGILVFLISSLIAGFAPNMLILILCRGLQGVGAGAVGAMAMTILWPIASGMSLRIYMARGFRFVNTIGAVVSLMGNAVLLVTGPLMPPGKPQQA